MLLARIILTQQFIACKRLATKEEIDEMVAAKGFRDNKEGEGVNYIGDRLYLEDMHPANVFIDSQSGKPICIDCIVKFIKKESIRPSPDARQEKKTNMNHLQSLLNIPRILSTHNIENELESIAKVLMNEFYIYNGTYKYRPVEIEFYIYHKYLHADEHVYKRDKKKAGDLFYHYSGFDICFESSFNEGFFGGILIRALERVEDNTFWGGPLVCKNEVLNTAEEKCKLIDADKKEYISLPATERKGIKKSNELDLYWNKKYRFVREGINNPIEMTITDFQFKEKHIKERKNKYYL